jgi:hypothetical protein
MLRLTFTPLPSPIKIPPMETITLSEAAVATLRFEIKGYRLKLREQDLPAYRELVDAGIMEPFEGKYRFTPWGMEHRDGILERESDRIEAGRMPPPDRELSETARERLRLHLAGDDKVTEENHAAYRELEAARVVFHTHPFVGGDSYRLTYWGYKLKDRLLGRVEGHDPRGITGPSNLTPVPEGSPSPAC